MTAHSLADTPAAEEAVLIARSDDEVGKRTGNFRPGRVGGWVAFPILMFVTLLAWSFASPPGAEPDADYHLVSAWCALGTQAGRCEPGTSELSRFVPIEIVDIACFKFDAVQSADCGTDSGLVETSRGNFAAYYPDGFSMVMGLLVGPSVSRSVVTMRVLNSVIYTATFAALLFFADPRRRGNYMLASLVTMTPLGIFVIASMNPSSWAMTAATVLWAGAFEFGRTADRIAKVGLGILVVIAALLAFA